MIKKSKKIFNNIIDLYLSISITKISSFEFINRSPTKNFLTKRFLTKRFLTKRFHTESFLTVSCFLSQNIPYKTFITKSFFTKNIFFWLPFERNRFVAGKDF